MKRLILISALSIASLAQQGQMLMVSQNSSSTPITLIQSGMTAAAPAAGTAITAPKSTLGANLLVACIADFGTNVDSFSSIPANTWILVASYMSTNAQVSMYYAYNANVSASQTFSNMGNYTAFAVLAFSNAKTASIPLDQHNGDGTVGVASPGSITPGSNNQLVVNCEASNAANPTVITGGGTLTDNVAWVNGANEGITNAYIVQTSATAINPGWNQTGDRARMQASFQQ